MKVSFIVPCRDKERHVGQTVDTVLAQTYHPMEIILSDQGSEDGTLEILRETAAAYRGPNVVRVLQCPDVQYKGMAGLNAHLNWLHKKITGDIVIMCSADDLNHWDRAKRTVEAFETFNPSYVGTGVRYIAPDGKPLGETDFPGRRSRWIKPTEAFRYLIGSSASSAWARDLYEAHGPLRCIEAQDMILPIVGLFERGLYYLDLPLHIYVTHAGLDNTGIEGQIRAARNPVEYRQLLEVNNFHNLYHWTSIARRLHEMGALQALDKDAMAELSLRVAQTADAYAQGRAALTMERTAPVAMRV